MTFFFFFSFSVPHLSSFHIIMLMLDVQHRNTILFSRARESSLCHVNVSSKSTVSVWAECSCKGSTPTPDWKTQHNLCTLSLGFRYAGCTQSQSELRPFCNAFISLQTSENGTIEDASRLKHKLFITIHRGSKAFAMDDSNDTASNKPSGPYKPPIST